MDTAASAKLQKATDSAAMANPSEHASVPRYTPPWAELSLIAVAGSSGSGKTSLAVEIVKELDLPWVIILSIDSFYKSLNEEQNRLAHLNEYDLDSPASIDFDLLYDCLRQLKQGKRVNIPVYSFPLHQRLEETVSIYSPHVIILEGNLALNDPRIMEMLDMKIFVEADLDVCLSRRLVRDVRERGRDIEGIIKQWFDWVKPVYQKWVEPQKEGADVIVPRGMQNKMAIAMIVNQVRRMLKDKSIRHKADLDKLGQAVEDNGLPDKFMLPEHKPQIRAIGTILRNTVTTQEDFVFYFNRLAAILIEMALDCHSYVPATAQTATGDRYNGLKSAGIVSAVVILRGGSCLEPGLKRTIPDCLTGRILIQSNLRTAEPELHYLKLFPDIEKHKTVLLLDSQMSSGGAALMAVKILVDHGVAEEKIVFVTGLAGKRGLKRLMSVFPNIQVVAANLGDDYEKRWIEERYFGC